MLESGDVNFVTRGKIVGSFPFYTTLSVQLVAKSYHWCVCLNEIVSSVEIRSTRTQIYVSKKTYVWDCDGCKG